MSLFKELNRRNVFRVGIAYIVIAWLIAQVLQLVFESFGSPDWVMKTVLVLMGAGLPFVLFFAWAFELTPEGLKREHQVDRSQSVTPQTGKKLDRMITVVLVLALGYFAYDKFVLSASREAANLKTALDQTAVQPEVASPESEQSDKSIAVLPFVNMSDDASNEYFSDGLSEELLNLLAKIPELRVTSRSSAFAFKGEKIDLPEVARKLNVLHVLEGSVRRSGNQVRITAQLIDARTDTHLWSETYDRSLDDVFAIQDEIAKAVVAELRVTLLGAAPRARETNPEAYALFLQAQQLNHQLTAVATEQSILMYEQALALDPDYAAAWVGLADNYVFQGSNGILPTSEGYRLGREAADRALLIDPNNASALAKLGMIAFEYENDPVAAARHYQQALKLEPTNPDILLDVSRLFRALGRDEDSIAIIKYMVARDPVNPRGHYNLGVIYLYTGRLDDAIASFRTALSLSPGYAGAQSSIGYALLLKGEPEAALWEIQQDTSIWKHIVLPMAYHALGRATESDAALAELIDQYQQDAAYNIAYVLTFRGEADKAFEWLDKAVQYKDPGLSDVAVTPEFSNIHDDPRWLPFLQSIGRSPEQLAAIEFQFTLPQ